MLLCGKHGHRAQTLPFTIMACVRRHAKCRDAINSAAPREVCSTCSYTSPLMAVFIPTHTSTHAFAPMLLLPSSTVLKNSRNRCRLVLKKHLIKSLGLEIFLCFLGGRGGTTCDALNSQMSTDLAPDRLVIMPSIDHVRLLSQGDINLAEYLAHMT